MAQFIAIPVGQGDAFYFERDNFSVLVDGGRSRCGFAQMFKDVTKRNDAKVVICTHNDADHANGILGFLEAGLRCEEIWLPGRWLALLPDVLKPFVEVFDELEKNVAEMEIPSNINERPTGLSPLEAYEGMREQVDEHPKKSDELSVNEDGWPESCIELLEQAEPWEDKFWFPFWLSEGETFLLPWHLPNFPLKAVKGQLLWSAIEAASQIRKIAIAAFHRGIPVRWFEFNTTTPEGGVSELQPINARAVARVRPRVDPLLLALALSVSNRESLVFWSPPIEDQPGVLFTADSDLAGVNLPSQLDHAIVTAPHHGSEANANAYNTVQQAVQSNFPSIKWVRSDGNYKSRPGETYLSLSQRFCTLCRGSSTNKQPVHLFSQNNMWVNNQATRICSCQ